MANSNVILPPPAVPKSSQFSRLSKETVESPPVTKTKPATKRSVAHISRQKKKSLDYATNINGERIEPASYRNSTFHNICTSILSDGYHKAFTELFTLIQNQREEHKLAGPAAVLLSPLIDDNKDKLQYLQRNLIRAEEASRHGDLDSVYMIQKEIALNFDQQSDHWLSDHFHNQCLVTGSLIKGDNGRKKGEAHFHVALAYENRGDLQTSSQHMEIFHKLTSSHSWHSETGDSLYRISCEHLRRIYTSISEKSDNMDTAIEYLHKAHEIAKKGKDTYQEGLASHRLGCAYEKINDYDTAIQHHISFLERVRYHGDEVGVGSAYEALARCHERKGDMNSAVKCLELFVEVAERTGADEPMAKAYSAAGIMFNSLGDYKKAVEYFSKLYSICHNSSESKANKELMESSQVYYGIAQTHYQMVKFTDTISDMSDSGISQMVDWKGKRSLTIDTNIP